MREREREGERERDSVWSFRDVPVAFASAQSSKGFLAKGLPTKEAVQYRCNHGEPKDGGLNQSLTPLLFGHSSDRYSRYMKVWFSGFRRLQKTFETGISSSM